MIPKAQRRSEEEFWAAFYRARPAILRGLLDALAGALGRIDSTQLEALPRMADFARWAVAAEPALGWQAGSFMAAYEQNRGQAHELAVEASPIGSSLIELAAEGFEGTATELLGKLDARVDEKVTTSPDWPKNGRALSGALRRLAPNLRALGYTVDHYRAPNAGRRRLWRLRKPAQ
jgi:putative DNA primase/helicase